MTTDGDTTQGERIERVAEALGLAHEIPGGSKSIYARALDDFVALTTTLSEQEAELERLRDVLTRIAALNNAKDWQDWPEGQGGPSHWWDEHQDIARAALSREDK